MVAPTKFVGTQPLSPRVSSRVTSNSERRKYHSVMFSMRTFKDAEKFTRLLKARVRERDLAAGKGKRLFLVGGVTPPLRYKYYCLSVGEAFRLPFLYECNLYYERHKNLLGDPIVAVLLAFVSARCAPSPKVRLRSG